MKKKITRLLFIEDSSVDLDELEELKDIGIKIIVYRAGSQKPELWNLHNEDNVEAIGFDVETERDRNETDNRT